MVVAQMKEKYMKSKSSSRLYKIFQGMKSRCFNKNNCRYKNYGGKGITIYKEWLDNFESFYNWAYNNGYNDNLTIERIDINKDYCPENCKWITKEEQYKNTSKTRLITAFGKTQSMMEWCREYNISRSLFRARIDDLYWEPEKALTTPPIKNQKVIKKCRYKKLKWNVPNSSHNPLYTVWQGMKDRCYCNNSILYKNYGERGIIVCEDWKTNFELFYNWAIQNGYKKGLSLDRIDVNGNYEPNNCRWTTNKIQANNKTNTRYIEYQGKQYTISELSEIVHKPYSLLHDRIIRQKWTIEKAISIDNYTEQTTIFLTFNGKTQSLHSWANEIGISRTTLKRRINKGLPIEEILSPENKSVKKIIYNNQEYTISELSKMFNIPNYIILQRLSYGWNIEKVLKTPIQKHKNKN